MTPDPRNDAKIAQAKPFAQPLLRHIRSLMHKHCPDGAEDVKWGTMAFTHKGVIVAMAGAFKEHATFGFWYGRAVTGGTGLEKCGVGEFWADQGACGLARG